MRIALFLIFLIVLTPMAVSAHGADKFSIIVRGTRMDPDTVQMVQNDTVEFLSVNNSNRTVHMDFNGDGDLNDTHDFNCNLPSGGMCALEMNVTNYTGDLYIFEILEEDGSLAFTLNLTLINDTHDPNSSVTSPAGYSFGNLDVDEDGIPDGELDLIPNPNPGGRGVGEGAAINDNRGHPFGRKAGDKETAGDVLDGHRAKGHGCTVHSDAITLAARESPIDHEILDARAHGARDAERRDRLALRRRLLPQGRQFDRQAGGPLTYARLRSALRLAASVRPHSGRAVLGECLSIVSRRRFLWRKGAAAAAREDARRDALRALLRLRRHAVCLEDLLLPNLRGGPAVLRENTVVPHLVFPLRLPAGDLYEKLRKGHERGPERLLPARVRDLLLCSITRQRPLPNLPSADAARLLSAELLVYS